MILFREHRGSLQESMKTLVKFHTLDEFVKYYFEKFNCDLFDIRKYSDSIDTRINWPFTAVVSDNEFCRGSHVEIRGFLTETKCNTFYEFCFMHDYMLMEFIRPGVHRSMFK